MRHRRQIYRSLCYRLLHKRKVNASVRTRTRRWQARVSHVLLRQGPILPQVLPFSIFHIVADVFTDSSTLLFFSALSPPLSSLSKHPHIFPRSPSSTKPKARVILASMATSFSNSNILMDDFATRTTLTTGMTRSSAKRVRICHTLLLPLPSGTTHAPPLPSLAPSALVQC